MSASTLTWEDVDACEGSAEFQAMAVAARGTPERVMGDSVIAAEPPDWVAVRRAVDALAARAPAHVAALVIDVKACAGTRGPVGLSGALEALHAELDAHWPALYPPPDEDDPDDPWYARINLLRELAEDPAFAESILRLPLLEVRGIGAFCARDVDIANGKVVASEEEQARCQLSLIRGAARESDVEALRAVRDAIRGSEALCGTLEALVAERASEPGILSLAGLSAALARAAGCFAEATADVGDLEPAAPVADEPAASAADSPGDEVAALPPAATGPAFGSHAEVREALAAVTGYYRMHEPASPVAVLAERASDLVGKGFFDVLTALAPGSPDSFASLVSSLRDAPLDHLLEGCYARFTASGDDAPVPDAGQALADRAEVLGALERIDGFYRRCEPSSPVPLLIDEMRRLVPRGFAELLADFSARYAPAAPSGDE